MVFIYSEAHRGHITIEQGYEFRPGGDANTTFGEDEAGNAYIKDVNAGTFLLEEMGWTMLTSPLTSTNWDGDSYSDVATSTKIELRDELGVPEGIRAVLIEILARDSAAWGAQDLYFCCGPSPSYMYAGSARPAGGDVWAGSIPVVPCDSNGDI